MLTKESRSLKSKRERSQMVMQNLPVCRWSVVFALFCRICQNSLSSRVRSYVCSGRIRPERSLAADRAVVHRICHCHCNCHHRSDVLVVNDAVYKTDSANLINWTYTKNERPTLVKHLRLTICDLLIWIVCVYANGSLISNRSARMAIEICHDTSPFERSSRVHETAKDQWCHSLIPFSCILTFLSLLILMLFVFWISLCLKLALYENLQSKAIINERKCSFVVETILSWLFLSFLFSWLLYNFCNNMFVIRILIK